MPELDQNTHVHFLGIGGIGVSALAELAQAQNMRVSGQDVSSSNRTTYLQGLGIEILIGQSFSPSEPVDILVYSSAIKQDHPALETAKSRGTTIMHRSEFLALITKQKTVIAVTGTHGKTTTSALITHMLIDLGLSPHAALGGVLVEHKSNAICGEGEFFVIEADESDGTFLNYQPFISVVTNIDRDHMDYYKTEEAQHMAFRRFLELTDHDGATVLCWDDANIRELADELPSRFTYGTRIGAEVRLIRSEPTGTGVKFDVVVERDLISCHLPLMGRHNVVNALAALAVARCLDLDVQAAAVALERFQGVEKRMSILCDTPSVKIIADYAHNPGKIAAAIDSVIDGLSGHRLAVIFQPHRYSRIQTTFNEHASAFQQSHHVFVTDIYAAGESPIDGLTGKKLAQAIQDQSHVDVTAVFESDDLLKKISDYVGTQNSPCVVLIVGAGDIHDLGPHLARHFQRRIHGAETKTR